MAVKLKVTAMHYLFEESSLSVAVSLSSDAGEIFKTTVFSLFVSFDMPADKVYIDSKGYGNAVSELTPGSYSAKVNFSATYYGNGKNDGYYGDYYGNIGSTVAPDSSISFGSSSFERIFTEADLASEKPSINKGAPYYNEDALILSDELLREIAESSLNATYRQASLFFSSDAEAGRAAEIMRGQGYIAVASYTTFEPDPLSTIGDTLYTLMLAFVWGISIVFLAFFVNLCSSGVISAFKGDMAIMRSMGIPVTVIRIGMYVRMMISLIPALVLLPISAVIIFLTPDLNEIFVYLYGWQYALIVIGVILLAVRVTYKQIAMLFGESVKKSLRRGGVEK